MVIRTIMDPWRNILSGYLDSMGKHFDEQQQFKEVRKVLHGDEPGRDFRMLMYAKCTLENIFMEEFNFRIIA